MASKCIRCGGAPATAYKITRGSVVRTVTLCGEHGGPLEVLLRVPVRRQRVRQTEVVELADLKPSKAILARARQKFPPETPKTPLRRGASGGRGQSK